MSDDKRVLHRGSERYVFVPQGADVTGERLKFPDRESARVLLTRLAAEAGNRELLRAAVKEIQGGVPKGFGGRPDENEWAPLSEGLARRSIYLVRLIDHPIAPFNVTTTGKLTLSEVSWGETSGIYPSRESLYKPDKWDQEKMCELLRARAAVNDVAKRNSDVRKAKPGPGSIEQMMRPYHCIENFPDRDKEIDDEVKWFYLSSFSDKPLSHPGTTKTVIAKTYGPFHNIGGGDVPRGDVYLYFYKLGR
jgi:hypothetical protein